MVLPTLVALAFSVPLLAADLAAVNIQLHDYEDSPAVPAGQPFRASETVYLSFHISGFGATEDDHIHLTYDISAFDPDKRPLGPAKTGKIETQLAPEDKKKGHVWLPKVRYQVKLPVTPTAGMYNIKVELTDKINGAKQTVDVPFPVEAPHFTPSDKLTIQNFRFLRSESEKERLPEGGAFRHGDAIWARFDITGYKFGPGNRYEVKYGLDLKEPEGKSLFSNPNAAEDKSESFYPRTSIPGELRLNLDKNTKSGDYTLVILVSDPIGNQTFESSHAFRVE
ncbi:MAG: hypothetical protein ABI822_16255 [Bryobacteraceae bacterium]